MLGLGPFVERCGASIPQPNAGEDCSIEQNDEQVDGKQDSVFPLTRFFNIRQQHSWPIIDQE